MGLPDRSKTVRKKDSQSSIPALLGRGPDARPAPGSGQCRDGAGGHDHPGEVPLPAGPGARADTPCPHPGGLADDSGAPADWVNWLKIVLGLLLLALAARQWRGRPRGDGDAALPSWMQALDTFRWRKAAGAGAVLAAANPKNLLLAVAGAAVVALADLSSGQEAGAIAVFVAIATIGVAAPVVVAFAMGERSREVLDGLRAWLADHNAAIMTVLLQGHRREADRGRDLRLRRLRRGRPSAGNTVLRWWNAARWRHGGLPAARPPA
jgi:hypothetical protein